jgi:GNAT superfamily N-acetyltransferase
MLSAIAQKAKAHWGYPASRLAQWRKLLTITPEFIAHNETCIAAEDDRPVAFYALRRDGAEMRLEHLWVLPNEMSRGLGRKLFEHAAARASALGADCLTIEADPHAEPFYLHLGAIRSGMVVSEIEGERREIPLLTFPLTSGGQSKFDQPTGNRD